ncbi:MAG: hypothetical protein PVF58_12875 [Candidatus Methanofastidiosia archaeon]|jgi:orotate phosphoribosyltransferase
MTNITDIFKSMKETGSYLVNQPSHFYVLRELKHDIHTCSQEIEDPITFHILRSLDRILETIFLETQEDASRNMDFMEGFSRMIGNFLIDIGECEVKSEQLKRLSKFDRAVLSYIRKPAKSQVTKKFLVKDSINIGYLEGDQQVAMIWYPYFFFLDTEALRNPRGITRLYVDAVRELEEEKNIHFHKIAFIEKEFGPIGSLLLCSSILSSLHKKGCIVRLRRENPDARIIGDIPQNDENICILYDLVVTGREISKCANILREYSPNVNYCVVLYEYGKDGKEFLMSKEMSIRSILEDNEDGFSKSELLREEIIEIRQKYNTLIMDYIEGKIKKEEYKSKKEDLLKEYPDLGIIAEKIISP